MESFERRNKLRDAAFARHPALLQTLNEETKLDGGYHPELSLDQVAEILIADHNALEATKRYLNWARGEDSRDEDGARGYLAKLGWAIANKLLAANDEGKHV